MGRRIEVRTLVFVDAGDVDYEANVERAIRDGWEPYASSTEERLATEEDGVSRYSLHHVVRLKREARTTYGD